MNEVLSIIGGFTVGVFLARGIVWASERLARWLVNRKAPKKHVRIVVEVNGQPAVDVYAEHVTALTQRHDQEKVQWLNTQGIRVFSVVDTE